MWGLRKNKVGSWIGRELFHQKEDLYITVSAMLYQQYLIFLEGVREPWNGEPKAGDDMRKYNHQVLGRIGVSVSADF